jgi:hypothetical protein
MIFLCLVAGTFADAAIMGFTRQFHFPPSAGPSLHWVALPWNYQPQDVGTPGVLDAEDLCQDLGGEDTIAAVLRWDEATSAFAEHLCGAADPFALDQGEGYGLRNVPGETFLGALAGVHDDTFAYSIPPSGGSQLSWLSVPYHLRIPEKHGSLTVDAEDLCRQIGLSEVLAIVRWNDEVGAYEAYGCGSALQPPFELVRGEAYGVVNRMGQTVDWQPIHY